MLAELEAIKSKFGGEYSVSITGSAGLDVALYSAALRKPRNRLVNDRLKNGSGDILLLCALI